MRLRRRCGNASRSSQRMRWHTTCWAPYSPTPAASTRRPAATSGRSRSIPGFSGSWYDYARCRKLTDADRPTIARMEKTLAQPELNLTQRVRIHLAIGKAYDDLADHATAIRHYDQADTVRARIPPFDRPRFTARVNAKIARFTPELFAQPASVGLDDATPVLIVGMPRSGTTLAEQILSSHPAWPPVARCISGTAAARCSSRRALRHRTGVDSGVGGRVSPLDQGAGARGRDPHHRQDAIQLRLGGADPSGVPAGLSFIASAGRSTPRFRSTRRIFRR